MKQTYVLHRKMLFYFFFIKELIHSVSTKLNVQMNWDITQKQSKSLLENLKKFSGNDKQNHAISMDTFYEDFKNLKNYEDDDDIDRP